MSKFFNETQKANQLAQQQLADRELSIKEMLETVKQGSAAVTERADSGSGNFRQVKILNGAASRLILHQDRFSQSAVEAYHRLRTRLIRAQEKGGLRSIVVSSSLPGEGKTLTTMNLGLCYAQLPQQRVLVIDADLRTCGLTALLEQPGAPGLGEVLSGRAAPEEAIVATNHKNLFAVPAGNVSSSPAGLFSDPRWQAFLARCGELFKVILIDSPPIHALADFELISAACDGVLMVVRAHHGRRETVQKTASAVELKKLLGVVFNGAELSASDSYGYGYGYGKT